MTILQHISKGINFAAFQRIAKLYRQQLLSNSPRPRPYYETYEPNKRNALLVERTSDMSRTNAVPFPHLDEKSFYDVVTDTFLIGFSPSGYINHSNDVSLALYCPIDPRTAFRTTKMPNSILRSHTSRSWLHRAYVFSVNST